MRIKLVASAASELRLDLDCNIIANISNVIANSFGVCE